MTGQINRDARNGARATLTRDLRPGSELYNFLQPEKLPTIKDRVRDVGEVVGGAVMSIAEDARSLGTGAVNLAKHALRLGRAQPGPEARPEVEPPTDSFVAAEAPPAQITGRPRELRHAATFPPRGIGRSLSSPRDHDETAAPASPAGRRVLVRSASARAAEHRPARHFRYNAVSFRDHEVARAGAAATEEGAPAGTATEKDIATQLKNHRSLRSDLPNRLAVIRPGEQAVPFAFGDWKGELPVPFQIVDADPLVTKLLAIALKDCDPSALSELALNGDTSIAVRFRGPTFQAEVADPVMALGKIEKGERANGESVDLDEQVFYPLFDSLMRHGHAGLNATIEGQPVQDFLAENCGIEFKSHDNPKLDKLLNDGLKRPELKDLRMRMALLEVAKLNYFENADVKEATKDFLAGTLVGMAGELATEFGLPSGEINILGGFETVTYAVNVALGGLIDLWDNYKGRSGAVELGAANASEAALAQQKQAAWKASLWGAMYGTLFNVPAQMPLAMTFGSGFVANPYLSTAMLATGTALSIVGSSLSIPFQMLDDETRKTAVIVNQLKQGIIELPDAVREEALQHIDRDLEEQPAIEHSPTVLRWAKRQAQEDMSRSIASKSSGYGGISAPLLALAWATKLIPNVPRAVLQAVIFGASPGAENMSTAFYATRVGQQAEALMEKALELSLSRAAGPSNAEFASGTPEADVLKDGRTRGIVAMLTGFGKININQDPKMA